MGYTKQEDGKSLDVIKDYEEIIEALNFCLPDIIRTKHYEILKRLRDNYKTALQAERK